ncbi:MAG: CBS domain-containing protein [Methylovirgula sp.]|uniref:CBS domain-containing protein n=1 Tax=Methylovirgula sp. TaxID=1978224 RepID=UPI0030765CAF
MTIARILATKGREVETAQPHRTLLEISQILAARRIGAVVISDAYGALLGILSERDIVRALGQGGVHALDDPASSHMTINVITITEDVTVLDAVELMNAGRFRHMPIMKDGRVDGIISIGDVVKFRLAEIEQEQSAMREYIATV